MSRALFRLLALAVFSLAAAPSTPAAQQGGQEQIPRIRAAHAARYVGRNATVCGMVASTNHLPEGGRRPTFLNLDRPFPDHVFTVVIWGADRRRFRVAPETAYRGRRICVTGRVSSYEQKPQMVVTGPAAIRVLPAS